MLTASHQIKSGHHKSTAHAKRLRRSWAILGVILAPIAALFVAGFLAGVDWPSLVSALGISFFRLLAGYSISLLLGVLVALLIAWGNYTNEFLPLLDVLQNIPSFALIPLFAIVFGFNNTMIIIFTATAVIWPILFSTLSAIKTARADLNDAATVFGATGAKRLWHYLVPLSTPSIITGSIVGISIGWEAVIGVEIIGKAGGIGTFLNNASLAGANITLVVGIVAILCLVFVINRLIWTPLLADIRHYGDA